MMLVGARGVFCAGHSLPQHREIHGHSYEVWVYVGEGACAEELQRRVQAVCKQLDHRMLNDVLGDGLMETVARHFAVAIPGAKNVVIARPVEGLECRYVVEACCPAT